MAFCELSHRSCRGVFTCAYVVLAQSEGVVVIIDIATGMLVWPMADNISPCQFLIAVNFVSGYVPQGLPMVYAWLAKVRRGCVCIWRLHIKTTHNATQHETVNVHLSIYVKLRMSGKRHARRWHDLFKSCNG